MPNQIHDGTAQIKLDVTRDRAGEGRSSELSGAHSKQKISENHGGVPSDVNLTGDDAVNHKGRRVQIYNEDLDKPKKKKVRPLTAEEKALKVKVAQLNATTRWLADSAFTTYYGKPAFHAYGKGNTNPTNQNSKFLTHNINGVTGKQKATFKQVYDSALIKGLEKSNGVRVPQIPKTKEKFLPEEPLSGQAILP